MTRLKVRDFGTALSFNASHYVSANTVATSIFGGTMLTEFTISAYYKSGATGQRTIVSLGNTGTANTYVILDIGGAGTRIPRFTIRDNSANTDSANGTVALDGGRWHHLVGVKMASSIILYVDGVKVAEDTSLSGTTYTFDRFTIGALNRTSLSNYFVGVIDEVHLWNRALSDSEVSDLYYNGLTTGSTLASGLVGKWLFNEGSGSTAYDTSGNGNNGTITGATYTTDVPMVARESADRSLIVDRNASALFSGQYYQADADFISTDDFTFAGWVKWAYIGNTGAPIFENGKIVFRTASSSRLSFSSNYSNFITTPLATFRAGEWVHVIATRSGTSGSIYINNVLMTTGTAGTPTAGTGNVTVGATIAGATTFRGNMNDLYFYNRVLTSDEREYLYKNKQVPTDGLLAYYKADHGGSNLIDSSVNGRNMTGSTTMLWSTDTRSKERKLVNGNLLKNGDFRYQPPFTAATTTSTRYIDGTSAGSTTNDTFKWWLWVIAGSGSAQFEQNSYGDKSSIKISATNTSGRVQARSIPSNTAPAGTSATPYLFKLEPSTSYTFTGAIKTVNAATDSVYAYVREVDGVRATVATNNTPLFTGDNDWTRFSVTFTTGATTRAGYVALLSDVSGNVSDAYFADLKLIPTTPEARQTA